MAQWPTTCVELNDIVEAHLGNANNVEIYQRVFGEQAEAACRNDHRADVQGVFAWAFDGDTPPAATPVTFASVSTRWLHVCGLRTDGAVECSGDNGEGQATPPAGRLPPSAPVPRTPAACDSTVPSSVGASTQMAGQRRRAGRSQVSAPEIGIAAGFGKTAWLNVGGVDTFGQAPAGRLAAVSAGAWEACGVRDDGSVACWGLLSDT